MGQTFVEKKDLNAFFNEQVIIGRKARRTATEITHDYVNQLLKYIHQKDPRFGSEPFKMGSAAQRLKVSEPNEFDFGVIINISELQWTTYKPRYFKLVRVETKNGYVWYKEEDKDFHDTAADNLQVIKSDVPLPHPKDGFTNMRFYPSSDPLWRDKTDMHYEDFIVPFLVKRCFKKLLVSAVRDLELRPNIFVSKRISGPAVTILITDEELENEISVDFALTVRQNMSFPSGVTWPHRNAQWPSQQKAMDAKAKGVNFVAKKDYDWLISYAEPERELRTNMDEDGGCRAKVHRIMKRVNEEFLCHGNKPMLSSYHLKNVLFWECEKFPRHQSWAQDQLAERFNATLDSLKLHLETRNLPCFFDPRVNMLKKDDGEKYDKLLDKIASFREHSSDYLRELKD